MHRSGTSFLARALNLRGVYLGNYEELSSDEWRPAIDNPRGHWENQKFLELADKTLSFSKGSWDNIPDTIRINSHIGKKIKKFSNDLTTNSTLSSGLKDPRILLCLDAWLEYLPKNLLLVGIFRNPLKVSESLKKRNGFSYLKSLELWKIYNENLLNYLQKFNGFLLDFDWPKKKLLYQLDLISKKIGLPTNIDISQWYTKDLFKSDKTFQKDFHLDEEISDLYKRLKKRSERNSSVAVKSRFKTKDPTKTIQNLLLEIQNQNNYFKILNDKNLEKLQGRKNNISKLTEEIKNKESEITRTKKYISKLTKDLSNKEEEIYRSKDYIVKIPKDLKEKESELTENKDYISKLTKDLQAKDTNLTQNKDYISKLTKDLQAKDTNLTQNKDYISKLTKDLQAKGTNLTQNKDYISKLTKDLQAKDTELSKNTNYNSKLTKGLEDKDAEINRGKKFVSRLSNELSHNKDEIKNLEDKIIRLEENIYSLRENKPKYYSRSNLYVYSPLLQIISCSVGKHLVWDYSNGLELYENLFLQHNEKFLSFYDNYY